MRQRIRPEIYREKAFDGSPSCPEERLPAAQLLGETADAPGPPHVDRAGSGRHVHGDGKVFAAATWRSPSQSRVA